LRLQLVRHPIQRGTAAILDPLQDQQVQAMTDSCFGVHPAGSLFYLCLSVSLLKFLDDDDRTASAGPTQIF
jgi:hypothetical protein